MAHSADAELVAVARWAFELLWHKWYPKMTGLLMRRGANPEDAEELAADAFLVAHRLARRFEGRAAFSTWLYRIAVNEHISRVRYRNRVKRQPDERAQSIEALGELPEDHRPVFVDRGPTALEVIEAGELWQATQRALGELPADVRRVTALRCYGESAYRDGLPKAVVHRLTKRGFDTLRGRLAEWAPAASAGAAQ